MISDTTLHSQRNVSQTDLLAVVKEYLKETGITVPIENYLREFSIVPIVISDKLIGFWGVTFRQSNEIKLATVKAFYIQKEFRGSSINTAADALVEELYLAGITNLEIWCSYGVQKWFLRRYGIKPNISISHDKIEKFLLPHQRKKLSI